MELQQKRLLTRPPQQKPTASPLSGNVTAPKRSPNWLQSGLYELLTAKSSSHGAKRFCRYWARVDEAQRSAVGASEDGETVVTHAKCRVNTAVSRELKK